VKNVTKLRFGAVLVIAALVAFILAVDVIGFGLSDGGGFGLS
jgi:hypothetical protein